MLHPKERMYLTADGTRLVPEGHEDGKVLFATPYQAVNEQALSGIDHSAVQFEGDAVPKSSKKPTSKTARK